MVRLDSTEFRSRLPLITATAIVWVFLSFLHGCAGLTDPRVEPNWSGYEETGVASYYARKFHNRTTASGERLNNNSMTAAHRTLPFGTDVIVRNINNGKSVQVRINDRGPFVEGRIIDLTRAAFAQIADLDRGLAKVEIRVVK
jgi:rare lipoprotein A